MNPPLMTSADWADYYAQTDTGSSTYSTDDAPEWLRLGAACPVCGEPVGEHDSVTVDNASGEIIGCLALDPAADWQYLTDAACPVCGADDSALCIQAVHAAPYCPNAGVHSGKPCTVPQHLGLDG